MALRNDQKRPQFHGCVRFEQKLSLANVSLHVRLLWPRGRRSGCPGRAPQDCQTFSLQNCAPYQSHSERVSWLTMKHSPATQTPQLEGTTPRRRAGLLTCRGLKWREEQRKGSGYFSPAAVPSSSSGIRCGSIAYHGRRQKWRCLHNQRFFNSVRETGDIAAQAVGRSFLDDK